MRRFYYSYYILCIKFFYIGVVAKILSHKTSTLYVALNIAVD